MEQIINYIKPELLITVPVLYGIGMMIKQSGIQDRWIPLLLGTIGICLATLWVVATSQLAGLQTVLLAIFTAVTQGILCAGCSVYIHQLQKQKKE